MARLGLLPAADKRLRRPQADIEPIRFGQASGEHIPIKDGPVEVSFLISRRQRPKHADMKIIKPLAPGMGFQKGADSFFLSFHCREILLAHGRLLQYLLKMSLLPVRLHREGNPSNENRHRDHKQQEENAGFRLFGA